MKVVYRKFVFRHVFGEDTLLDELNSIGRDGWHVYDVRAHQTGAGGYSDVVHTIVAWREETDE